MLVGLWSLAIAVAHFPLLLVQELCALMNEPNTAGQRVFHAVSLLRVYRLHHKKSPDRMRRSRSFN